MLEPKTKIFIESLPHILLSIPARGAYTCGGPKRFQGHATPARPQRPRRSKGVQLRRSIRLCSARSEDRLREIDVLYRARAPRSAGFRRRAPRKRESWEYRPLRRRTAVAEYAS